MARRASSKISPITSIIAVVVIILIFVGIYIFFQRTSDPFRNLRKLNVSEYMENSRSLAGNRLYVNCRMTEKIRWQPNIGGLWAVDAREDGGEKEGVLPIFIPSFFDDMNIQVGQELKIQVTIDSNGVLVAEKIIKL